MDEVLVSIFFAFLVTVASVTFLDGILGLSGTLIMLVLGTVVLWIAICFWQKTVSRISMLGCFAVGILLVISPLTNDTRPWLSLGTSSMTEPISATSEEQSTESLGQNPIYRLFVGAFAVAGFVSYLPKAYIALAGGLFLTLGLLINFVRHRRMTSSNSEG